MNIEWHGPAGEDRFTPGREGTKIDRIVIHTMVGWISSADRTFKSGSRQVSAHYGVRVDGTIWQWVKDEDTAWHANDWEMNQRSIAIEHEDAGLPYDPRPDALYEASSALVRELCQKYSIPVDAEHIIPHRQITNTACPATLDVERIIRGAVFIPPPPVVVVPVFPVLSPDSPLTAYARKVNPDMDLSIPRLYEALSPLAGILPEVAFAQALHETGNFRFGGTAQPEWHNPAGLGVTGAVDVGNRFPDWESGIRAHLGHLLWYFGPHIPQFCDKDQRHFGGHKNLPNDLRQLNGKWAVPGRTYGESIYAIVNKIRGG